MIALAYLLISVILVGVVTGYALVSDTWAVRLAIVALCLPGLWKMISVHEESSRYEEFNEGTGGIYSIDAIGGKAQAVKPG